MKTKNTLSLLVAAGLLTVTPTLYAGDSSSFGPSENETVIADVQPEQVEPQTSEPTVPVPDVPLDELVTPDETNVSEYQGTPVLPQSTIELPFYEYGSNDLLIHQSLDKLVVDIMPHEGTQSALILNKYTGQTIPNAYGRYVAEPRLNSEVPYAASNLDGENTGRDELTVIGKEYMRFIFDMEHLGDLLGDGTHELVVIEYTTPEVYRGEQRTINGVTQPAEFENAIDDRYRFWITYADGELDEVTY